MWSDMETSEVLADVFQFTPSDLRINQRGIISERQKGRMHAGHEDSVGLTRGFFIFIGIIGLLGSGAAALNEGIPLLEMWKAVLVSLLLFGAIAWAILTVGRKRMEHTIEEGHVAQVSGTLHLRIEGSRPKNHYFCVGARKFSIDSSAYRRLAQGKVGGQQATVYYTTRWEWILSVDLEQAVG